MKSILLLSLFISICWAAENKESAQPRPVRAPQGHLQYSDPDGSKVSWKLFSPNFQRRSYSEDPRRDERAESGTVQPNLRSFQTEPIGHAAPDATDAPIASSDKPVQVIQQTQVQYKPYSMVPPHIKQLMSEMYEPRVPYIDPSVFTYRPHQQFQEEEQQREDYSEKEESSAQSSSFSGIDNNADSKYERDPKFQTNYQSYNKHEVGLAKYEDDQPAYATAATRHHGAVQNNQEYHSEEHNYSKQKDETQKQDDRMPKEIYELLNLQAQIPYHVIADKIIYKPKSMFIPKPFKEDQKGPYKYRTKIYYIKNDESEEQQNKERRERDEPKELTAQDQQQQEE